MVRTRTGTGGPQPAEVRRMLAAANTALARDQAWVKASRLRLVEAEALLNRSFLALSQKP
jgi:argininosuccinate lyase